MTVPMLSRVDLMSLLQKNGWEITSNDFFDEYDRIILKKGDITFPLQYKENYAFTSVVRICISLDIDPPGDHLRCYKQWEEYKKKKADPNKK